MNKEMEDAAKEFIEQQEGQSRPKKGLGSVEDLLDSGASVSPTFQPKERSNSTIDIGWYTVELGELPSEGKFYNPNMKILIRAAQGEQIKHWSTLQENDQEQTDSMLNYMLEKLCQVTIPGLRASYKDLLDIDRLYIIWALSELTFKNGQNQVTTSITLEDGTVEKLPIRKENIKLLEIPEVLQKYYDDKRRAFVFEDEGEEWEMRLPTVGVSKFIYETNKQRQREGKPFDLDVAMYAIFMAKDWRTLTEKTYKDIEVNSHGWSIRKISIMSKYVDLMRDAINPQMTLQTSAGEVTRQLDFQGGLKSLFIIPDIL